MDAQTTEQLEAEVAQLKQDFSLTTTRLQNQIVHLQDQVRRLQSQVITLQDQVTQETQAEGTPTELVMSGYWGSPLSP